jgi:Ser/Thr protein kinase RdoA (MazF antagonist)
VIPAAHTVFDGPALGARIAGMFEIGPVQTCALWRSFINDIYRIDAGGRRYWLRIHPAGWRTRSETAAEIEAILIVAAAGGRVARPLPASGGDYIVAIEAPEGVRGACDAVRELPARAPLDANAILAGPAAVLAPHLSDADRAVLERVTQRFAAIVGARSDLSVGFCHGDLNNGNLHFNGDVATAIDFDCCAWGWRAFELAAFARGVTWHSRPGDAADALVDAYVEGYRAQRPIGAGDLALQPAMLIAQRLWLTALHLNGANRWGALTFGAANAARFVTWLRAWEPALERNDRA